jgi:hypothetical protein
MVTIDQRLTDQSFVQLVQVLNMALIILITLYFCVQHHLCSIIVIREQYVSKIEH